ncbi:hypothetical protein ID866_6334 [Astraeus odoratus]|nr:hypothetical protein ID866_6334 [Astraeus odoratus]
MKFVTLSAALAAAVSAVHGLTINTPASVVACEPTQFTWDGGSAPYYLSLVPGGQPTASPIKQFPNQDGTSYTWLVDLQAGTIFNIALKDSTGATSYSDIITIQSGSSTSCLNTAVEEGSSTSGSSATGTSGSGSGAAATTS